MKERITKVGKGCQNVCHDFLDGDFFGLGAELSFYLLSCFLPMIICVFTIASSISQLYTDAMLEAISVLPDKASKLLIKMLVSRTRSTTVILITGGFSLFTMSGFMLTAEKALNRFYKVKNHRGFLKSNFLALIFAIFIFISIIASFALIIFGSVISNALSINENLSYLVPLWNRSRHIIVLVFIALVISAIYKVFPVIRLKLYQVLPGAVFTTLMWYITSMVFALYVNNFPQYEIIYGSLAGFACMIMWIYLTGIVILAGAKINAMLYFYMNKRKMQKLMQKEEEKETINAWK